MARCSRAGQSVRISRDWERHLLIFSLPSSPDEHIAMQSVSS